LRNRSGDATGAISDADQSIGLDPTYATAYRFRAQAREQLGHQAQQILADFKKAAELDPEQASYYSDAVTRLGGQKSAPNPDTSQSRNIYAGIALLLLLLVAVWSISRRRLNPGAPSAAMTASAPAELGGQYDIGEKIGEGGMGAVYKGWDKLLKRPVAIKRLIAEMQENQRDRERFIREAETVASLHHPNIVEIYTIIRKSEQETYLVFEYLVGGAVPDHRVGGGPDESGRIPVASLGAGVPSWERLSFVSGRDPGPILRFQSAGPAFGPIVPGSDQGARHGHVGAGFGR
jgi:tetratricopeptide (TPR) repeat protein